MSANLRPDKALVFRIAHFDNVAWILRNGMYCRNLPEQDPNYVNIGKGDLIRARNSREIPCPPGGTLGDYVPFYFTPYSIMLYNIKTGYGDVIRRANDEIVIFVSSLHRMAELGIPFLFTDRHAYTAFAEFHSDLADLDAVDWPLLRSRDFRHDPDDPGKKERYQAEALVHRHVPIEALLGVGCHSEAVAERLRTEAGKTDANLDVKVTKGWYF